MNFKESSILYTYAIAFTIISLFFGCASMRNPEGGPRDTTPPKVLKMTPENLTTNFSAKKIIIEFDEYIKLNNVFKEFSISPELEKEPELKVKLKKLEISIPDTLEKNTTYTLNFGKAIADLNENNELKNFSYAFATGPTLDSLSIKGHVTNALTGQPEIENVVYIIPLEKDSLYFGKKRAPIFTLSDSSGNFQIKNLRKDTYKIYVLKEKSGDRIYQQENDEIGFRKEPIVLDKNIDSIQLSVFKEIPQKFRVLDRKFDKDGSIFLSFNQHLKNPNLEITFPKDLDKKKIIQFNKTKDSASLWLTDLSFDSVKIVVKDFDKVLDTVRFSRGKRDTYSRVINIGDNTDSGQINPFRGLKLKFNLPIEKIDESKIFLLEDSIPRKFTLEKDSLDLLTYHLNYKWKSKEPYILDIKEDAITAIFDTKNKAATKKFTLDEPSNYGTLALTIESPDSTQNYILEIVNENNQVLLSHPIKNKQKIKLENYKQGVYYARIIYDTNKNGVWDTGNVKEQTQPEAIWYEPKELSIRANWDREESIKIPLVPTLPAAKKTTTKGINPTIKQNNFPNTTPGQNRNTNPSARPNSRLKGNVNSL